MGSKSGTPQKSQSLQQQQLMMAVKTPTNQPIPPTVTAPTPRTPLNVARTALPPGAPSRPTPSFGQYNYGTPTPVAGECISVIDEIILKMANLI